MAPTSRSRAKRVTITDIAHRAGVSISAVSSALNGGPHVSAATRERIEQVARELGWAPASAARSLAGARTDTVGLVLHRDPENLGVESFYMQFLAGLESELSKRSYGLLLQVAATQRDALGTHEAWTRSGRVDGMILTDLIVDDPRIAIATRPRALPSVVVGPPSVAGGLTSVWTDDGASMRTVVRHLLDLGHTRIAHIAGLSSLAHTGIRTATFREEIAAAGGDPIVVPTDYTPEDGARATREILDATAPPTAVIYDNDVMAVAGLGIAMERGVRVPDELSIVAWDDSVVCQHTYPALTAIGHDVVATGAHVARRLFDVMAGEPAQDVADAPTTLFPRASTGPVRA